MVLQQQQQTLSSSSFPHLQGERHGSAALNKLACFLHPHPPHQWVPGGEYGGIQGNPRLPKPLFHAQAQKHQLPQQQLAHLWFYNQWTMLPDNRYGVPQHAMDQNWSIPNPNYG